MRVFEAIPACGHWLPLEQPEVVTAKILDFIHSTERRGVVDKKGCAFAD